MPRYFFHIHDDLDLRDDEGMELAGESDARRQALAGVREMMCDEMRRGLLTLHHRVEVEDEAGERVLTLAYGDAVTIRR